MNKKRLVLSCIAAWAVVGGTVSAQEPDFKRELTTFTREMDIAQYETPLRDAQVKAFDALTARAIELGKKYPKRAEPLVLQALALREHATVMGQSMDSMMLGKRAIEALNAAIAIDPKVYGAIPYVELGYLYLGPSEFVPAIMGFKDKARGYLENALTLDPVGIEQNLGYAQLLFNAADYTGASKYAAAAARAPQRPGRNKADADLHAQAEALIIKTKEKLR